MPNHKAYQLCFRLGQKPELLASSQPGVCLVSGKILGSVLQKQALMCSICQLGCSGYFLQKFGATTCFFFSPFLHCFCKLQESVDFELSHRDLNLDNEPSWDRRKCYQTQSLAVINLKLGQNFVGKEKKGWGLLAVFHLHCIYSCGF